MKRIIHKAKNFSDAEKWDILQHISMTAEERQRISRLLKIKYYGNHNPDVRRGQVNNEGLSFFSRYPGIHKIA